MRVHHLNCGTMRPLGGRLVDGAEGMLRTAEMVCHCLLIETTRGLVLVDTGFGTSDVDDPRSTLPRPFRMTTRPVLDQNETAVQQRLHELARHHHGEVDIICAHGPAELRRHQHAPEPEAG